MSKKVEIRQLTSTQELTRVQTLETAIWKMPPIPVHQTLTAINNGGIVLGAFDQQKLVGFLYSFAGFDGKKTHLCSHMLGILPSYRKGGLGVKMKLKQAEIAKSIGYNVITWTFDPLESLNAHLNLHKLGAVGVSYMENHYGEMTDSLNEGLPSDRILIKWYLKEEHRKFNKSTFNPKKVLLDIDDDSSPYITMEVSEDLLCRGGQFLVAIPENFQTIKSEKIELAKTWRFKTRKIFNILFNNGYHAFDLIRNQPKQMSYYIFGK